MMTTQKANRGYFGKWYEKNKDVLSAKRKERYQNDPVYRQQQLENRRRQLAKQRGVSPLDPAYTTTFSEAAEELGITLWRLRNWRNNSYFPEPHSYGKFLYFTDNQVGLLKKLAQFIADKPRLNADDKDKLQDLVQFIYGNW
jgi:hypothetical protein